MTNPKDMLARLSEGDVIRFRTSNGDIDVCEAEILVAKIKCLGIGPTCGNGLFGDASDGLWIEYIASVDEEYPVLVGPDGTEPNATITEIEVIEENSLLG